MDESVISDNLVKDDEVLENTLRPKNLSQYIGQKKVKNGLRVFIGAAKKRGEPLDHLLICGPPGLGKTTLAHVVATEMSVNIKVTSGPAIERTGDLASILTNLQDNDILFIDEIHRLNKVVEEILYPAMEDYAIDLILGKGPSAKTMRLDLPHFTLIGATTRMGLISSPMRSRFGMLENLDFYSQKEVSQIILRSAKVLKIKIDKDGITEIAKRSRFTPRIANRLLKRARDYAQIEGKGVVNKEIAQKALEMLEIDEMGLDKIDKKIIESIAGKFGGGPVGLKTIAATIHEEEETISEVYEPYLLQIGFITRTSKGRILTENACKHIGININKNKLL